MSSHTPPFLSDVQLPRRGGASESQERSRFALLRLDVYDPDDEMSKRGYFQNRSEIPGEGVGNDSFCLSVMSHHSWAFNLLHV